MSTRARGPALSLAVLLVAFAALHAYWALGGRWGLATVLGPGVPAPAAPAIWSVAAVSIVFALAAFALGRHPAASPLARRTPRVVLWLLVVIAGAVGIANLMFGTRAPERYVIGPFALVVSALAVWTLRRSAERA